MRKSVSRGSLLGMASQMWYLLAMFALYAYLARHFGPADFGQWRVIFSLLIWLELFVGSGLPRVASKWIAEGRDSQATSAAAYFAEAVLASALFLLVQLLAGPVGLALRDAAVEPLLRIAALDIPFYAAFSTSRAIAAGMQRFERQAAAMFVYPLSKLVTIVVLVQLGFGVPGALVGNVLASVAAFAVAFVPWSFRSASLQTSLAAQMARRSVPYLAIGVLATLPLSLDLWLVKAMLGDDALAGLYGGASSIAQVPLFLFLGLHLVLFPSITKVTAGGEKDAAVRYSTQAMRFALLIGAFGIALIVTTGHQILALLYSQAFAAAFQPLVILMVAGSARTIWATCDEILLAVQRQRESLVLNVAMIFAEVALLFVLIPRMQLAGAALAVAGATILITVAGVVRLRGMFSPQPIGTLIRSAAASTAVGLGLAFVNVPLGALPLAYVLAAGTYVTLILLLGEARADDLASIRRALAGG